jgi:hypothetical protein
VEDPWGLADPPAEHDEAPLPPRLAALAGLTEPTNVPEKDPLWRWPAAEELPEVRVLMAQGWYPLDGSPLHGLLPTAWPAEHRCWLPDRLPKVSHRYDGVLSYLVPAEAGRRTRASNELVEEEAVEAGLPLPPPGRIWLLRSPFRCVAMPVLLRLIWQRSEQVGHPGRPMGLPRDMVAAGRELASWSESEFLDWWTGREADAAQAWRALGRTPGEVAELVVRGLGPGDLEPLLRDGLTEADVVGWHDVLAGTGRPLADTVRLWRGRGVGLDDTPLLTRLVWWPDEEVAVWAEAGFGFPEMEQLAGVPLVRATQWRDAGYLPADIVALLQADELLSPVEAGAFTEAGITGPELLTWVECGFAADEAAAWTAVDVRAQEARVWRAAGLGPSAVEDGRHLPPDYELGGWIFPPADPRDLVHQIDDPPGTRGRVATRRRALAERVEQRRGREA